MPIQAYQSMKGVSKQNGSVERGFFAFNGLARRIRGSKAMVLSHVPSHIHLAILWIGDAMRVV